MLTRRENLLVRPWQQRRFHNHRKKVESALPAVDVGPPAERGHVSCKLKQVQSEGERCAQIGRDNCALVLRLAHIMRTSRVDNAWRQPPPKFLRRVGIYLDPASAFPPPRSPSPPSAARPSTAAGRPGRPSPAPTVSSADSEAASQDSEGRNLRCSACHPRTALRALRRERAGRAPCGALAAPPESEGHDGEVPAVPALLPPGLATRGRPQRSAGSTRPGPAVPLDQVVITYKALRLAISFPPHASVRIRSARPTGAGDTSGERELRPARIANRTARTT